jgi:hypothetical protein
MVIPIHHLAHDEVCRLLEQKDLEVHTTTTTALGILSKRCGTSEEDIRTRAKAIEGLFFALSRDWDKVNFQIGMYPSFKLPHDRFAALLGTLRALGPVRYWHQEARGGPRYQRSDNPTASGAAEDAYMVEEQIRMCILALTKLNDEDADLALSFVQEDELARATRSFVVQWRDLSSQGDPSLLTHDPVRIDSALRLLNEMNRHEKEARLTLAGGIIMDALTYALMETVDAKVLRDHLLTEDVQLALGFSTEIEDD